MKPSLYYHGPNVWAVSFGPSRKRACERAKEVRGVAFRDEGVWFVVEGGIMPNMGIITTIRPQVALDQRDLEYFQNKFGNKEFRLIAVSK